MTTREEPGWRPQSRRAPGLFAFVGLVSACAMGPDEFDPVATAQPVVLEPMTAPAGTDDALIRFYESILAQMLEAHQQRDLVRLRSLLDGCSAFATPAWVSPRIEGFAALATGLRFELACESAGVLRETDRPSPDDRPSPHGREAIGSPLDYELELPAPPDGPWLLGAGGDVDPVAFQVALVVREFYLDGNEKKLEDAEVVRLPQQVLLDREPLRLPLSIDLGGSDAVRREVELTVQLLPGYVHCGDARAPVRTTVVARGRAVQWPPGHEVIRTAPLRTLQNAQRLGDRAHFKHVRLAAEFASPEERPLVRQALMGWVRLGRPDQALVAMAALRATEGQGTPPVGDREAWLSWWESRR